MTMLKEGIRSVPDNITLPEDITKMRAKYETRQMNFDLRRPGTVQVIPSEFFEGSNHSRTSLDELKMIAAQNQSGYILDNNVLNPDTDRYGLHLDGPLHNYISSGGTILVDYVGNTVPDLNNQKLMENMLNRLRSSREASRNR